MCVVWLLQKQRKRSKCMERKRYEMTRQNAMKCVRSFFRGWSIIIIIIMRTKPINTCGNCSWWYFNNQRNSIIILFNILWYFLSNNNNSSFFHSLVRFFVSSCVYAVSIDFMFQSLNWEAIAEKWLRWMCYAKTIQRTIEIRINSIKRLLFFFCVRVCVSKTIRNFSVTDSDYLFGNRRAELFFSSLLNVCVFLSSF